jgi:phosphoribosylglycinamide formyltransferase-1
MNKAPGSILFIGDCSFWSKQAYAFLENNFRMVTAVFWEDGMSENPAIERWSGDWIISFKSDLILSETVLSMAKKGAINFHPSSTKYRGIGGYYYAIDNSDVSFGATCHHMNKNIDHGEIIKTVNFEILRNETHDILRQRTAVYCLTLLYEVCATIARDRDIPQSNESWGEKLYTKTDLRAYLKSKENTFF